MPELNGKGGVVSYNAVPLAGITDWDWSSDVAMEVLKGLAMGYETNLPKHIGWKAGVNIEGNKLSRDYGTIAVGDWDGINLLDYDWELSTVLTDLTGQNDIWQRYGLSSGKWTMNVNRYETSENFGVFCAMLDALATQMVDPDSQTTPLVPVSIVTPFGSCVGYTDKTDLKSAETSVKSGLSLVSGSSDVPTYAGIANDVMTPSFLNAWGILGAVDHMIQCALGLVLDGEVPTLPTPLDLDLPWGGTGNAWPAKVKISCPDGVPKLSIEFTGHDAFTAFTYPTAEE